MYLNLKGSSDVRSSADQGLEYALKKIASTIRPLSQRSSASGRLEIQNLKGELEELRSKLDRGRIVDEEADKARARIKEITRELQIDETGHSIDSTPLARLMGGAQRASLAEGIVVEAQKTVSDWVRQIPAAERKLLENPAYSRSRTRSRFR